MSNSSTKYYKPLRKTLYVCNNCGIFSKHPPIMPMKYIRIVSKSFVVVFLTFMTSVCMDLLTKIQAKRDLTLLAAFIKITDYGHLGSTLKIHFRGPGFNSLRNLLWVATWKSIDIGVLSPNVHHQNFGIIFEFDFCVVCGWVWLHQSNSPRHHHWQQYRPAARSEAALAKLHPLCCSNQWNWKITGVLLLHWKY